MQGTGDRLGFGVRDVALRSIASWVMRVQGACGGNTALGRRGKYARVWRDVRGMVVYISRNSTRLERKVI